MKTPIPMLESLFNKVPGLKILGPATLLKIDSITVFFVGLPSVGPSVY